MTTTQNPFDLLRQMSEKELVHLLESSHHGNKVMVIEDRLMKPLDRICRGVAVLRSHGVDKFIKLDSSFQLASYTDFHVVFLVSPLATNVKLICDIVNSHRPTTSGDVNSSGRRATVIFVPRKTVAAERLLESHGVHGLVAIEELPVDLIPLGSDLLSLELPEFFTSFYLDGCYTWVHSVARSLWNIQSLYGNIPKVMGIGRGAEMAIQLLETITVELGDSRELTPTFSHCILVDRDLDYATVLLSGLSYGAICDEIFEIKSGVVELPPSVTGGDKPMRLVATDDDEVFASIRDRHFSTIFSHLSCRARDLQAKFDKRNDLSVQELKEFVGKDLKGLKQQHRSLQMHIGACEEILRKKTEQGFADQLRVEHSIVANSDFKHSVAFIEDWMCGQQPETVALALLCLLSLCSDGIPTREYNSLRTQYVHAYGFKNLLTWHHLKRLGILVERESVTGGVMGSFLKRPQFQTLVKKWGLFGASENVTLRNPTDLSYIFNGAYVPLICQVVAQILQTGFSREELSKSFFCPIVEKVGDSPRAGSTPQRGSDRAILVYFIGGVTYAEMACLKLLGQMRGLKIVIASTHMINRHNFLSTISKF